MSEEPHLLKWMNCGDLRMYQRMFMQEVPGRRQLTSMMT